MHPTAADPSSVTPPASNVNNNRKSRHRSTKSQTCFHPLTLGTKHSTLWRHRHNKIASILAGALSVKVADAESLKFLERFRYILVSSRLLDKISTAKPSTSNNNNTTDIGSLFQRHKISNSTSSNNGSLLRNCDCGFVLMPKNLAAEKRFWVSAAGSTGCAIAVLVLLAWATSSSSRSTAKAAFAQSSKFVPQSHNGEAPSSTESGQQEPSPPLHLFIQALHQLSAESLAPASVPSPQRSIALAVVAFGVSLFIYAYTRRRAQRMLRLRLVTATNAIVCRSADLDATIAKSFSVLKEIDLLARGYRPDLVDMSTPRPGSHNDEGGGVPDITEYIAQYHATQSHQLQAQSQRHVITGKYLRASLASGLYLLAVQLTRSIQAVFPHCNRSDLDKYLDIYELDLRVLEDFGWELSRSEDSSPQKSTQTGSGFLLENVKVNVPHEEYLGAAGAQASLAKLKLEFYKVQFLRSVFVCCLLSIPVALTSGLDPTGIKNEDGTAGSWWTSRDEMARWEEVLCGLMETANLMQQLVKPLSVNQLATGVGAVGVAVPDLELANADDKLPDANEEDAGVWRRRQRSLNTIFGSLQHIEARMEMLRDTSNNGGFPQPEIPQETGSAQQSDFETNFNLVGSEIYSLLDNWQRARQEFATTGVIKSSLQPPVPPSIPDSEGIASSKPAPQFGYYAGEAEGSSKKASAKSQPPSNSAATMTTPARPPQQQQQNHSRSASSVSRTQGFAPLAAMSAQQYRTQQPQLYSRIMEDVVRAHAAQFSLNHHRREISELSGVSGVSGVSGLTLSGYSSTSSNAILSGATTMVASPEQEVAPQKYAIIGSGFSDQELLLPVQDTDAIDYSKPSTQNFALELGSVLNHRRAHQQP